MSQETVCIFCSPHEDPHQHIVLENETCYFLQHDHHQDVLEGSGVIVPKAHRLTAFDLTPQEWMDLQALLLQARAYLGERCHPDGYTLGWNVGPVSNQEIPHAHFHVIPRYADEPYAGKGIRHWLKQEDNRRRGQTKVRHSCRHNDPTRNWDGPVYGTEPLVADGVQSGG